jgi:hypothetical protein
MNLAVAGVPRRSVTFPASVIALLAVSLWFYYRQNFAGQIGGTMSVAKLLWLDYALLAWFIVPCFVWRSPLIEPQLRGIYGAYLANFLVRGVVELWMLYVTISWLPPYGITHDLFSIGLVTTLLLRRREKLSQLHDEQNLAARRFLVSIRLGLVCEIILACLFYRATEGRIGIYFASDDPHFAFINRLTWAIVLFAYADLLNFLWRARRIFFPIASTVNFGPEDHSYEGTSV